jgi:hypothetical protein
VRPLQAARARAEAAAHRVAERRPTRVQRQPVLRCAHRPRRAAAPDRRDRVRRGLGWPDEGRGGSLVRRAATLHEEGTRRVQSVRGEGRDVSN